MDGKDDYTFTLVRNAEDELKAQVLRRIEHFELTADTEVLWSQYCGICMASIQLVSSQVLVSRQSGPVPDKHGCCMDVPGQVIYQILVKQAQQKLIDTLQPTGFQNLCSKQH